MKVPVFLGLLSIDGTSVVQVLAASAAASVSLLS